MRTIDAPQDPLHYPVVSFLFLGLTTSGKGNLVKDLAEHFATDVGANLLVRIYLANDADSGSLARLADALSRSLLSQWSCFSFVVKCIDYLLGYR